MVHRLLTAAASLVAEHRLQVAALQWSQCGLSRRGSQALEHRLRIAAAHGLRA